MDKVAIGAIGMQGQNWTCLAVKIASRDSAMKPAPGWVLISVNFDPMQEIESKIGSGHSIARLWMSTCVLASTTDVMIYTYQS